MARRNTQPAPADTTPETDAQEDTELEEGTDEEGDENADAEETSTDVVPLKRLCLEAKVDPKAARRKLRKAKFDFHALKDRWSFPAGSPQLAQVRKTLGLS